MFNSILLFASLGCIGAIWLSVVPNAKQSSQITGKSRFRVTLDGLGELDPEKILLLSMDVGGGLRDLTGHEFEESEFGSVLHDGNPKKPCLLRIQIYDEGKTSVATLSNLLAKLRAASDPQRETIIFLYLDENVRH